MLDDPGKAPRLLVAVQGVALPFGVHLTPPLARLLREEQVALGPGDRQTVSEVSYLGDEGGIVCHIVPPDGGKAAIVSLTHVRVPPSMPAAAPVGRSTIAPPTSSSWWPVDRPSLSRTSAGRASQPS